MMDGKIANFKSRNNFNFDCIDLIFGVLTPLLTICQLYHVNQF